MIYNALDLDRFTQLDKKQRCVRREQWNVGEGDILVGAVANLRPVKKLDTLIDAAAVLNKEFANLKFVIVGEGPLPRTATVHLPQWGLGDLQAGRSARRHRPMPRGIRYRRPLLRRRKLFQLAIEYMAAGLPVVASEVGGNSEAIDQGETGLLYSIEEREGLIGCLREIIQNPKLADTLGKQARKKGFLKLQTRHYPETTRGLLRTIGEGITE